MNIKNLFFHIHYCNMRQSNRPWDFNARISRTLDHHELIFFTGGIGNVTVENKKYQVKEGMIFYFYPNLFHSIESNSKDPICFFSVHFSYINVLFSENKWDVKQETKMLPFSHMQELKDCYKINDIFKKLVDSWNDKLPGYEFITKAFLQQLIYEVYRNKKSESHNYSVSAKVENIISYMHKNINSKITLVELSDMVELSPTYLSRTFKDITGYSVIEFFNKIKIDKAKELIIDGNNKVKEVANKLGFSDEFYFSRIFKKIEGMSPSEFYSKNVHEV
ncbi:AraC family transcriptional regulator [Clostridium sp. SHJSY1]|uniref:AraC family transcriptional regulator n=1 Tax=Clostridium sp. SHJSY1 TaxID=2942483 RepID=UPI0028744022|nr:AraC family transcriptional regulator [Clostridium sp. SHJSY1]MDS0525984.1 AraC family transcriptional regulator [Clostridium sp. SHJSY1]